MAHFDQGNFHPAGSPGYMLRSIAQLTATGLDDALQPVGLTGTQWVALVSLHYRFADTCVTLARQMTHDKGAMTRVIDELERRGWVVRERDDEDRRLVRLSLTGSGLEIARQGRERIIALWNHWLADWSGAEVAALIATLTRLRRSITEAGPCAA